MLAFLLGMLATPVLAIVYLYVRPKPKPQPKPQTMSPFLTWFYTELEQDLKSDSKTDEVFFAVMDKWAAESGPVPPEQWEFVNELMDKYLGPAKSDISSRALFLIGIYEASKPGGFFFKTKNE